MASGIQRRRSWPPTLSSDDLDVRRDSYDSFVQSLRSSYQICGRRHHNGILSAPGLPIDADTCSVDDLDVTSGSSHYEKQFGFRASVLRRWSHTRERLHDKLHSSSRQEEKPKNIKVIDQPDNSNLKARESPPRSLRSKIRNKYVPEEQRLKFSPQRPTKHPPHELSFWNSELIELDDRESTTKYPSAYSKAGELLYSTHRPMRRKKRTASGKRHAWHEPGREMVPVHEETESQMLKFAETASECDS